MATTATATLDIPMEMAYENNFASASKIKIVLSSDHTLRKSSLKPKLYPNEEEYNREDRELAKSVRWKEGTDLEDVMLIPPRVNSVEECQEIPAEEILENQPLMRESSSLDLHNFQSLKADSFTTPPPHSESRTFRDVSVELIFGNKTVNQRSGIQAQSEKIDRKAEIESTESVHHRPFAELLKALSASGTLSEGSSDDAPGPPPATRTTASSKRPFTKPTIRYTVPPFEYDVEMATLLKKQESFCSLETDYLNRANENAPRGKFYVIYTEDTDYNFLCLDELFKEVSRSIRFGTRMPSEKTTGSMIDDLQTEFKPAVVDAPLGFNPAKEEDWMDLGLELSMLKYKKMKDVSSVFPLTELKFKELILTGDEIGPLENYMLVSEDNLIDKGNSALGDIIPSPMQIHQKYVIPNPLGDPATKLKVLTGSPFRFPKLVVPSRMPHPEVARCREKNVHFVLDKRSQSPPPSPAPEENPVVKSQVEVETIYSKPNIVIPPPRGSDASLPKVRRHMLSRCRAKMNINVSPDTTSSEFTDDNTPISINSKERKQIVTPLPKYRPSAGDFSTFVKSSHWHPTPQLITKQTKMSLFKQILTEEEVIANTYALNSKHLSRRPVLTVPSNLYTDLQEHSNTIVLTRDDVLELLEREKEVPKYFTSSLAPGIYVPCAPFRNPPRNKAMPQCKHRQELTLPELKERRYLQSSSRIMKSLLRK